MVGDKHTKKKVASDMQMHSLFYFYSHSLIYNLSAYCYVGAKQKLQVGCIIMEEGVSWLCMFDQI